MTNAVISVSTSPVQIFSGTGNVRVQVVGSNGYLGGDNTVSSSNGFLPTLGATYDFNFQSPSEIWAVSSSTSAVRILSWY